jgi:hypothetical protein
MQWFQRPERHASQTPHVSLRVIRGVSEAGRGLAYSNGTSPPVR